MNLKNGKIISIQNPPENRVSRSYSTAPNEILEGEKGRCQKNI
jgi:hypothetical protein